VSNLSHIHQAIVAYKNGVPVLEIRDKYSVQFSIFYRYLKAKGIPLRGKGVPRGRVERMLELSDQGFTSRAIGRKFFITQRRVNQILQTARKS
jgi:hypothetical protein